MVCWPDWNSTARTPPLQNRKRHHRSGATSTCADCAGGPSLKGMNTNSRGRSPRKRRRALESGSDRPRRGPTMRVPPIHVRPLQGRVLLFWLLFRGFHPRLFTLRPSGERTVESSLMRLFAWVSPTAIHIAPLQGAAKAKSKGKKQKAKMSSPALWRQPPWSAAAPRQGRDRPPLLSASPPLARGKPREQAPEEESGSRDSRSPRRAREDQPD
jgi:hypothetical protein